MLNKSDQACTNLSSDAEFFRYELDQFGLVEENSLQYEVEINQNTHINAGLGIRSSHLISERIACFLAKNEPMRDSLKKMSDSLIRSFLVSDLSNSLKITHFL